MTAGSSRWAPCWRMDGFGAGAVGSVGAIAAGSVRAVGAVAAVEAVGARLVDGVRDEVEIAGDDVRHGQAPSNDRTTPATMTERDRSRTSRQWIADGHRDDERRPRPRWP